MEMKKSKIIKTVVTVISILFVALLGSVFVNIGMEWFNLLQKPSQWIPNFVIPIVWSVIYILFGIVLSIWINNSRISKNIVAWLIVNGVLNILWCLVFFTLKLTFVGNIVIIFNLIASIVLFILMYKQNILYAVVTSLYPIWLCLATSLNTAMWILN
jgi:tryptophan-rich sensory protein